MRGEGGLGMREVLEEEKGVVGVTVVEGGGWVVREIGRKERDG